MATFLVINGPNLNVLGKRDPELYGSMTLTEIEKRVQERAKALGATVKFFQSNHEADMVDYLQEHAEGADGIIINAGALTHYGLSLRDALTDTRLPIVEVHLSNVYAREEFRHKSVIAPIAAGQISGLGWQGYLFALEYLVEKAKGMGKKRARG